MAVIAEGLQLILDHVRELHADLGVLIDADRRHGAAVIDVVVQEEAAKALILLDLARMGWQDSKAASVQVKRFTDHLARGIYARVADSKPATLGEVRRMVDRLRRSHYLDGPNDVDWIFGNEVMSDREDRLYVDYPVTDEGVRWQSPASLHAYVEPRHSRVVELVLALERAGCTTIAGLQALAATWKGVALDDDTHWQEVLQKNLTVLTSLEDAGLIAADLTNREAQVIREYWPFPLGTLDMSLIEVTAEELQAERDAWLAAQY